MVAQPASAPASAPPTGGGVLESLGAEVLQDLGLVALALIVAYLLSAVLTLGAKRLTARTTTDLDDAVIAELRPAVSLGLFALGVWVALGHIELRGQIEYLVMAAIATAVAVISGRSVFRSVILVLREFGRPDRVRRRVPQRLIPLIEYTAQIGVWLLVLHAILVAWDVEAVLLQTMSGTLGLAVGLAAEGSLSNVISGLFIHADRSCRVGDYLQLDEGHRGRVTHIGLRSVRVLTDDHVEINIPNTVVGSARVVNETAGPGDDMAWRSSARSWGSWAPPIRWQPCNSASLRAAGVKSLLVMTIVCAQSCIGAPATTSCTAAGPTGRPARLH